METDWKKKYEEALERARIILCNLGYGDKSISDLETVFPELAESEDERIRKELIDFLREAYSRGNAPEKCAKWLVWLDWSKEQKPLPGFDDLTPDEKMNHPLYLEGFDAGREVGRVEAEQKPEWSEEDERHWRNCLLYFSGIAKLSPFYEDYLWLKSLKNRGNFPESNTNSQSWSEDEYKVLTDAANIILNDVNRASSIEEEKNLEKLASKLQSLRPSWKPSEEEVEALNYAIAEWDGGKRLEGLYALRNDLKKLM